jgi:hypothetical protein
MCCAIRRKRHHYDRGGINPFMRIGLSLPACHRREEQRPVQSKFVSDGLLVMGATQRLTYLPLIFQPGSSLSSFSANASLSSPTTTSLLIVRSEHTFGAPAALAIGPIATSKGVDAGAAQSYVSFR